LLSKQAERIDAAARKDTVVTEETTTSAIAPPSPASPASTGQAPVGGTSAGAASASTTSASNPRPGNATSSAEATQAAPAGAIVTMPEQGTAPDTVTVRMPADGAYLSVLRTATAGLAARLDFTLDDIEDMRIAVDEACAMLLGQAVPGSSLECTFALSADDITITVCVQSLNPLPPSADTFAWTVLSALAGSAHAQVGPADRLAVVMRKSRRDSGPAAGEDRD
jgi:serine/threonine-protein kinase RsbW